jgi:hypothetical protein
MTPAEIQAAADFLDRVRPKAHTAPRHSRGGVLISTPFDGGPEIVTDIITCGHCDYSWLFIPGSGRRRAFCMTCGRMLCGRPFCELLSCTCQEQRLENMENGRPFDFKPITISTAGLIVPGG